MKKMNPTAASQSDLLRTARARIRELDAETLEEQLRLVAIPAPTFQEQVRGAYVADRLREIGLEQVHVDEVGNVLGRLPGAAPEPERSPALVTAHLDTVFAAGVDVTPRTVGKRHYAPGITDNCRGLAALLATARVLVETGLRTARPLWFVATVGEEGAGDLRGVKHLFREGSRYANAAAFVSIDGSGLRRIVHRALGSRRLRVEMRGPGGHSWSDFGVVNAIHASAAAVAGLAAIALPVDPPTSLTVARSGGGTTINAVPDCAWFEVDMRSEGGPELDALEAAARRIIERAVAAENQRRRTGSEELSLRIVVIGDRPSGSVSERDPLVAAAVRATRAAGAEPEMVASSTDSNVAISLGIPAVTIGAGGDSGGIHTPEEWYENVAGAEGLERSLLVAIAAAGGVVGDQPAA
jgi:tripeptide aminopeptidase